jgi:hypothetical protein
MMVDWDLELIRARQRGEDAGKAAAIPVVPEPSEPVDTTAELRMIVEPGDLLCFSGAHLHASVPNTSGVTRFSLEARTVDVDDAASRRGAPNLDGRAPRIPLDWFHHIEDEVPLPEVMVRRDGRE